MTPPTPRGSLAYVRGFLCGVIAVLLAFFLAGLVSLAFGTFPVGADVRPSAFERWAAARGLNSASLRESKELKNPLPATEDNLLVGVRLYSLHCAVCHGAADGQPSRFEQGFYVKAPQFATHGVEDDPENVTYWKAEHGIRFTAMPAFKNTMPAEDLWKITMFLKRMDKLPPATDAAWKGLSRAACSLGRSQ